MISVKLQPLFKVSCTNCACVHLCFQICLKYAHLEGSVQGSVENE